MLRRVKNMGILLKNYRTSRQITTEESVTRFSPAADWNQKLILARTVKNLLLQSACRSRVCRLDCFMNYIICLFWIMDQWIMEDEIPIPQFNLIKGVLRSKKLISQNYIRRVVYTQVILDS